MVLHYCEHTLLLAMTTVFVLVATPRQRSAAQPLNPSSQPSPARHYGTRFRPASHNPSRMCRKESVEAGEPGSLCKCLDTCVSEWSGTSVAHWIHRGEPSRTHVGTCPWRLSSSQPGTHSTPLACTGRSTHETRRGPGVEARTPHLGDRATKLLHGASQDSWALHFATQPSISSSLPMAGATSPMFGNVAGAASDSCSGARSAHHRVPTNTTRATATTTINLVRLAGFASWLTRHDIASVSHS